MSSCRSTITQQSYYLLTDMLVVSLTTDLSVETLICLHMYNRFLLLEPSVLD